MQIFAIVLSFALTAVALALVVVAVRRMLSVLRSGQPVSGRTDNPGGRLWTMARETVLHTRMLQWTWVGIAHWFAFAAFLFLSTAVGAAYFQLFDPAWTLPVVGELFVYEWLAEILGLLGTLGIIPLVVYRLRNLPKERGRSTRFFGSTMWQAFFVEAMVLLESSAILFIRGAEYNLAKAHGGEVAEHATAFHFPVSQFFGNLYPTGEDSIGTLENIIYAIAAVKIVSAMIWLIVVATNLTMGIAWHRFTAWFNIFYKREGVGRDTDDATLALGAMKAMTYQGKPVTLEDVEEERVPEDATFGVGTIHDFSWKGILDFTTCTECGRCQSQCPAWNTEKPLSPKLLVMGLREHAYAAAPYRDTDGTLAAKPLVGKQTSDSDGSGTEVTDWFYNPDGGDFVIDEDVLWSCTSCGACVQQCPVDIEHVDHIMDMRRYQVLVESNFPSELNGLFKGLEGKGNPWNMNANARMDWAKDLPFEVKVVGDDIESLDEVDWLFWVGCAGAYEDRAKKTTRAVAELLDMAGVSFGVLGNGETCSGDPARRAGNEFVFQGLAQQNVETFKEYKVKKVVSTCAHCFNTLKNEYKDFGIELEVVHHTQLLNRLVREGKLTPLQDGAGAHKRSITYHDPCYIGRHNGVYSPPRELLQVLPGAEYKEMPRNSERSFCCGAGGARMWMEEKLGERINVNRTNEAVATGADQIAVGCPFCRVMLSDGLTAAQSKGEAREEVEVLDVAQMLLSSVKGQMATKLAPGAGVPAGAAVAAAAGSVETAAEPSAGDVTITEDTLVDTEDTGAAAKASQESGAGGTSLFDTPATESAPDDASSLFDTPAPAEPTGGSGGSGASGGSSLFDFPADDAPAEPPAAETKPASGGSLFDIPAEPAPDPSTKAAEAQPEPKTAEPASTTDLGAGGSLFDIPADPAPDPSTKAAEAQPDAKTAEPAPTTDLGAGGSLFDIPAQEAPAAPAAADEPAPAASAAAPEQVAPVTAAAPADEIPDLSAGGSLFDIPAQETPAAPAADAAAAAASQAPVEEAAPSAPAADTSASVPAAEPTAAPAAEPAGSVTASSPRSDVDIDAVSSLFDIEELEDQVVAATAPVAGAVETPPAEASAPVTPEGAADLQAEAPAPAEVSAPAAQEEAPVASPVASAPAPVPSGSGVASAPRADVDIDAVSSLFDIEAPEGQVVAAAAPAPAEPAAPGATAAAVSEREPEPAAAAPVVEETHPAEEAAEEPTAEEPTAEGTSTEKTSTAGTDAASAEPEKATTGSSTPTGQQATYSGDAHTPRTDVDIHEAGSLFDL